MTVNTESLGLGLLDGQKKPFEDETSVTQNDVYCLFFNIFCNFLGKLTSVSSDFRQCCIKYPKVVLK